MNKLFCLLGMSGSGKSSLEKLINESGIANKVVSTTTRKPRSFEKNGDDYYFISVALFNIHLSQGQYAEHSTYTTVNGTAQYGINKNDIRLHENNQIAVVNPDGFRQLVKNLGEDRVVGIYIFRDDRERIVSALYRDDSDFDKVLRETTRRYEADKIDFAGIENEVKYSLDNKDLRSTAKKIMDIIEEETNDK